MSGNGWIVFISMLNPGHIMRSRTYTSHLCRYRLDDYLVIHDTDGIIHTQGNWMPLLMWHNTTTNRNTDGPDWLEKLMLKLSTEQQQPTTKGT